MKSILIYRRGGIGDVLLMAPVIHAFKIRYPSAQFYGWGPESVWSYLQTKQVIDGWFHADQQPAGHISRAYLFTSQSSVIEQAKRITNINHIIPPQPPENWTKHILDYYAQHLGLPIDRENSCLPRPRTGIQDIVVIHPGSGSKTKIGQPERVFAHIEKSGLSHLRREVIFGPHDEETASDWLPYRTASFKSLAEAESLLLTAQYFIGMDSGISHLAGLLGVPGSVFFVNSDPLIWKPCGTTLSVN